MQVWLGRVVLLVEHANQVTISVQNLNGDRLEVLLGKDVWVHGIAITVSVRRERDLAVLNVRGNLSPRVLACYVAIHEVAQWGSVGDPQQVIVVINEVPTLKDWVLLVRRIINNLLGGEVPKVAEVRHTDGLGVVSRFKCQVALDNLVSGNRIIQREREGHHFAGTGSERKRWRSAVNRRSCQFLVVHDITLAGVPHLREGPTVVVDRVALGRLSVIG